MERIYRLKNKENKKETVKGNRNRRTKRKREKLRKQLLNPFLQRIFLLIKLPAAFFMGVRIRSIRDDSAEVTVPYAWRSQNPFKSIYFARTVGEFPTRIRVLQGHLL